MVVCVLLTLFKWMLIEPLASSVAVSPRSETILPMMRTVWFVNWSRYWALMRGVASLAILWSGVGGDRCCRISRVFGSVVRNGVGCLGLATTCTTTSEALKSESKGLLRFVSSDVIPD